MFKPKKLSGVLSVAVLGLSTLAPVVAPVAVHAQAAPQSYAARAEQSRLAHAALNPNDTTDPTGTSPTPVDTSAYSGVFDQMKATMNSVATGPVGLGAMGLLVIGIIFGVAWRLLTKGGSKVGR